MAVPDWDEVRCSLREAIAAALPLQLAQIGDDRVAGIGIHIDCFYGSAGLYLLPESAIARIDSEAVDNIGDWPISTDWRPENDYSRAFADHWRNWDNWFYTNIDEQSEEESNEIWRKLMETSCQAVQEIESEGFLHRFAKTEEFKIIIAEHDEPNEISAKRYPHFIKTGEILLFEPDDGPLQE